MSERGAKAGDESARRAFSRESAKDLVRRSVEASGGKVKDQNLDRLIDAVFAAAGAQQAANGFKGEIAVTSVSVTSPGGGGGPATMEARTGKTDPSDDGGWEFPWSGTICIWYCPEGAPKSGQRGDWGIPYDPERCYLICIEWTFP